MSPAKDLQETVAAQDEWSKLRSVILGRAENSCFPSEPPHMIEATMPSEHWHEFRRGNGFPSDILLKANLELQNLETILKKEGVKVYRPTSVDWVKVGGYTAAMPRDAFLTVGNTIIEACYAWKCRRYEVELAYSGILSELAKDSSCKIVRAPRITEDTLYGGIPTSMDHENNQWAINNSRPAFDAADFMRVGKTLIGQYSNVTNEKGVTYLRAAVPKGYNVEILDVNDPHAMHIDATILPLRRGLMIYNPERVTEESLRAIEVLRDWELHPYPFKPRRRQWPPLYMTSPWLCLNILSISESKVIIESDDVELAEWLKTFGIEAILCPFQHVNAIGGSFHCATVDLIRETAEES